MSKTKSPEFTVKPPVVFWLICLGAIFTSYESYKQICNTPLASVHCGYDPMAFCWIKSQSNALGHWLMVLLFTYLIFELSQVIFISGQTIKACWAFGLVNKEWDLSEISSVEIKTVWARYGRSEVIVVKFNKNFHLLKFYKKSDLQVTSTARGYRKFFAYLKKQSIRIVYKC